MDDNLGTLLSGDPIFFALTQPTTLQATQSTPNTPTQVENTLYPKKMIPLRPLQIYINPFLHI